MEFEFSEEKDKKLAKERGIGFDDVLAQIRLGNYEIIDNPNQKKYPGAKAFLLRLDNYPHIIPFEKKDGKTFLKTIFKMRKMKKILEEEDGEKEI